MKRVPLLLGRVVIRTVSYKSEVREREVEVDGTDIRNLYDLVREGTASEAGCVLGTHARQTCPLCSCLSERATSQSPLPSVEHVDMIIALRLLDHSGIVGRHCGADDLVPLKRLRMMHFITQGCERPALHCSDEVYTTLDTNMLPMGVDDVTPTSLTSAVHAFVTYMDKGCEEEALRTLGTFLSLPSSKTGTALAAALCWLEGCSKAQSAAPWLKVCPLAVSLADEESPLSGLLSSVSKRRGEVFGEQLSKLPPADALGVLASRTLESDLPLWRTICVRASQQDVVGMERALSDVSTDFLLKVLAPACVQWDIDAKQLSTLVATLSSVLVSRLSRVEGMGVAGECRMVEMMEFVQSVSRPQQQDMLAPQYPVDAAKGFLREAPLPVLDTVVVKDLGLTIPLPDSVMNNCRDTVTGMLQGMLLRGQRLSITNTSCREILVLRQLCRDRSPMASSHSSILNRIATCIALDDVGELTAILSTDLSPSRMLPSNSIAILKRQIGICPADSRCYGAMLEALAQRLVPVSVPRSMWDDMWTYIMVLDRERSAGKLSTVEYKSHVQDIFCQLVLSATVSLLSIRVVLMGILFMGYYSGKSTEGWLIRRSIRNKHTSEEIDETREVLFESKSDGPRDVVVCSTLYDSNPNSLMRDLSMQLRYSLPSVISACFFLYPIYSPSVQKYVIKSVCDRSDTTVMLHLAPGVQLDSYERMVDIFGSRCKVVVTAKRPPPVVVPKQLEVAPNESALKRVVKWILDHILTLL